MSAAVATLPVGLTFKSVSAGGYRSFAVGSDGDVYAWGQNGGTLGTGTIADAVAPIQVSLPNGVDAVGISTAKTGGHSLAVGSDGDVYAWGSNFNGQLGTGTRVDSAVPARVSLPSDVNIVRVSAESGHSLALDSDGLIFAWGDGTAVPATVSLPGGITATDVSTGWYHSLALSKDGRVYAWGENQFGQLGNGTIIGSAAPSLVPLPEGAHVVSVRAGSYHSLAITSDGDVYAWGENSAGQLGNGTTVNSPRPVLALVPKGVTLTNLSAGAVHSMATSSDGSIYAWGSNIDGVLGNGTTTSSPTPVQVSLPGTSKAVSVSTGLSHSLAVDSAGRIYAWGTNFHGELGNGTTVRSSSPVAIAGQVPPPVDSDGDGLPDAWETDGVDTDNDGVPDLDLRMLGADPMKPDIFMEIDWMEKPPTCLVLMCWGADSWQPDRDGLIQMVNAFADEGVTLHIDAGLHSPGSLNSGGNAIPWANTVGSTYVDDYDWSAFDNIRESNFDPSRRGVFHYALLVDEFGSTDGMRDATGVSRDIPGSDLIVAEGFLDGYGGHTQRSQVGTLMHELGHNLGLRHGGADDTTYKWDPIYRSVMNYKYQLGEPSISGSVLDPTSPGRVDYSDGSPFNDWANLLYAGGSVGGFGVAGQREALTTVDEMSEDEAREHDAVATPGDGSVDILGPNVFSAGASGQIAHARVYNPSSVPATYRLSPSLDGIEAASITQVVPAYSQVDVPIEFDATSVNAGDLTLQVSLWSETLLSDVDSAGAVLVGLNTSDPSIAAQLAEDASNAATSASPPPAVVLSTVEGLAEQTPAPSPASTTIVTGDAQSQTPGKPFASPLKVVVKDAMGNPVAGQSVLFTVTSGSATFSSASSATAVTATDGTAAAQLTAGSKTGPVTISASLPAFTEVPAITFAETVVPISRASADLSVSVTGLPSSLKPGVTRTVELVVKNAGPQIAQSTTTVVNVGTGLAIISASGGKISPSGSSASWVHGAIATGKSVRVTLTVKATGKSPKDGAYFGAVTLSSVPDPKLKSNASVKFVRIT